MCCLRKITMFLRSTLLGILLFSILWTETALAGSSFLSPEYRRTQQGKDPKRPPAQLHHRGTGSFWDTDEAGAGFIEIKFSVPFEMGIKVTEEEYQEYGQVLGKMLGDILEENPKETQVKN